MLLETRFDMIPGRNYQISDGWTACKDPESQLILRSLTKDETFMISTKRINQIVLGTDRTLFYGMRSSDLSSLSSPVFLKTGDGATYDLGMSHLDDLNILSVTISFLVEIQSVHRKIYTDLRMNEPYETMPGRAVVATAFGLATAVPTSPIGASTADLPWDRGSERKRRWGSPMVMFGSLPSLLQNG